MSKESELRMDHKKYLQRCRERGLAHIAKMTPAELAALKERVKELEKLDPEKIFFDVHEVPENVVHERPRRKDMVNLQSKKSTQESMKKEDTLIFECVRERDIDLLLMEEWCVNPAFAQFFLTTVSQMDITPSDRKAMHSVSDAAYGENDIVLTFRNGKQNVAILVEDKIDAVPQPNQAKRYKLRAEKITASAQYDKVFICLVAPQHYLDNDTEPYPCRISHESIAAVLSDGAARGEYKANVLRLAISQERRRALPVKNDLVTDFWQNYHAALMTVMPDAIMPYPKIVPINSDWPMIRFPGFGKQVRIVHKMAQGNVDLETGLSESELRKILSKWDTERIMVAQTGKSFVLRIPVPPLDRMQSFASQEPQVQEAFAGIRIFHECMQKYGLNLISQFVKMKDDPAPYNERFDAPMYSVLSQCNGCIYMKDFGDDFAPGCEIISPEHSTPKEYAGNWKKCEHRKLRTDIKQ